MSHLPQEITSGIAHARRLEWWTLGWLASIVVVMYLVMGSSQAMQAAWIEDLLSLLPPIMVLVATWMENWEPTEAFPYGFHRVGSLLFFGAAMALAGMGAFLLWEAAMTLIRAEHPTIGTVAIFGREIWLGWLMMAALLYSATPPVILGRMKRPVARRIRDKILYTDADMNAADWQTGLAGIVGIVGIGFGFWWADAAAAGLISLSILKDGITNLRIATAELIDGMPRKIDAPEISDTARTIARELGDGKAGLVVRLRETGRYMRAQISDSRRPLLDRAHARDIVDERDWCLIEASRSIDMDDERPPPADRA